MKGFVFFFLYNIIYFISACFTEELFPISCFRSWCMPESATKSHSSEERLLDNIMHKVYEELFLDKGLFLWRIRKIFFFLSPFLSCIKLWLPWNRNRKMVKASCWTKKMFFSHRISTHKCCSCSTKIQYECCRCLK